MLILPDFNFQETIPHDEKIFSLFEPYTEWIKKGKIRNQVELGLRIAVATDQYGFILGYRVMQQEQDVDIAVPFAQELLCQYAIASISFDKGFWSPKNYAQLAGLVDQLIMPKKGKLNKLEQQREQDKTFRALRHQHAAVESAINCLEHHGLNRCPDKGLYGFRRYTALGILAYNLHKLGNILLAQDRKQLSKSHAYLKAA
jgi:IS5 family transposase